MILSRVELLVFDFDGVVADTEVISNGVLADALCELGLPTTLDDALGTYAGKGWRECADLIESALGKKLPDDFASRREARIMERLSVDLEAVEGVRAFLEEFRDLARCIASSSSPAWLGLCLERLALRSYFGEHVYSVAQVARPKPHPDIFLHAAKERGIAPEHVVVLEDSPTGVKAGVAAGMTTIGICAAKHVRPGHPERLRAAGAHVVVSSYEDVARMLRSMHGEIGRR